MVDFGASKNLNIGGFWGIIFFLILECWEFGNWWNWNYWMWAFGEFALFLYFWNSGFCKYKNVENVRVGGIEILEFGDFWNSVIWEILEFEIYEYAGMSGN